jgi:hypothetical protein
MTSAQVLSPVGRCLVMAVWEQLRTYFGSNRRNLAESHSTCANIKKAHTLCCQNEDEAACGLLPLGIFRLATTHGLISV